MQIIMVDWGHTPWIVPDVVDETIRKTFRTSKTIQQSGFRTSPIGKPFSFEVADPSDPHDFIFTSKNMPFVYVKNFMHLKFMVNSRHIFGLGERVDKFELKDGLYSLWNYDNMVEETGIPPGNNLYGSHMFYLLHLHDPRLWAGVFFLNSNPIDVKIQHVGMQTQIDHMFVGGIIDGFFMQKANVDNVIQEYHYLIGRPVPLPFWAFGYHQSRWGYRDIEHLKDMVHKFEINNLPLDAVWMDKDYMQGMRIFTINEKKWYGIKQFVQSLHDKGKRFVAIVDPAIAIDPKYQIYAEGLRRGVFLKGGVEGQPLKGVTWPGYSVWIDFLNPSADKFWEDCLEEFHTKIDFDGLWLDMNEPSNFCDGECPDEFHYIYYYFPLDFYDDLFYNPTHVALEDYTVSMEAVHYGNKDLNTEFNYHNLFPLLQTRITARFFMQRLHKRPFVISSGTFPGVGRYASHWLGDNYASWHYLEFSIAGVFNFGLFGIPFVGADICGFEGNTTINLCSRWMQLGAFYPFMRNHNGPGHAPQEPYIDPKLMKVTDRAVRLRYSLARYIYSEYMHTALRGGIVFKPVLFEFPTDQKLYSILDTTLMFGNAIRITPVLEDGVSTLTSYFPNWDWFEFPTWKKVMSYNRTAKEGQNLTLICDLEGANVNIHIRGGVILAYQPAPLTDVSITTISKLPNNQIILIVIPDHDEKGIGNIYYDDEEHPENFRTNHHDYQLNLEHRELKVKLVGGSPAYKYTKEDQKISEILILNAQYYKDTVCAKAFNLRGDGVSMNFNYEQAQERLTLKAATGVLDFGDLSRVMWSNSTC
jgi:alpha-glucosidase (family GH31 glycosyl hydrolase)